MVWTLSWVTSTSVNQNKEGLTYGTKHSPMVTRERLQCFIPFFHLFLKLLNLITRGGTPQPLRSYARYQGLIASLLTYLWLRREIFTATPMSSRTWGTGPFRVIMRRYASSFQSQPIGDSRANAFPVGCPNIPFLDSLLIHLVHSLN